MSLKYRRGGATYTVQTYDTTYPNWSAYANIREGGISKFIQLEITPESGYDSHIKVRDGGATYTVCHTRVPEEGVYTWGENIYGQLGFGDTTSRSNPTLISTNVNSSSSIAAGGFHSIFVINTQYLNTCGQNNTGQLGLGDTIDRSSLIQLGSDVWGQVYGGNSITMAIRFGYLWVAGNNNFGQLGLGDTTNRLYLTANGSGWSKVSTMRYHSAFLNESGELFTSGLNNFGQLGLGDTTNRSNLTKVGVDWVDVGVGEYHTAAIGTDGYLYTWGYDGYYALGHLPVGVNRSTPTKVGSVSGWVQVECSYHNTYVLHNTGDLYGAGANTHGQLGQGDTAIKAGMYHLGSNFVSIANCGDGGHILAIKNDGTLWGCGLNDYGQLGLGDTTDRYVMTQIEINTNWKKTAIGSRFSMGLKYN